MKAECDRIPEGITLLAGAFETDDRPEITFSEPVLDLLSALAESIRRLPRNEAGEEVRALGFWLRRAHLMELKEKYDRPGNIGLGQSFHIAPANVPLMFVYTCAIGLLAGNTCRVRVSERVRTREGELLCGLLGGLLNEERFAGMQNRVSIISYDSGRTDLTERFSMECDARIIWGGDETVSRIRAVPLKPSAVELVFPDRNSLAVLDAEAVLALSEEELGLLAVRFYNDTYAMDQNACSCPKAVFWREPDERTGQEAADRFWNAVFEASKRYALSEIKVSQKYGALWECMGFGANLRRIRRLSNRLYVLECSDVPRIASENRMQFGSFLEYHMQNGDEWTEAVSEKTQSVTCFGIREADLRELVLRHRLKGVHRVVPVGQALRMDPVWDGKDMIAELSRTLT